jgi:hypothetical protein
MNYKSGKTQKKAVLAWFKVLSRHLPGGTQENHERLSQDSRSPVQDFNSGPPDYKAGVPTFRPRRFVNEK